ncbi:AsmA-like C-terminal region-containing protein [Wolbachia pipientis]|nr:AsmA-like C-terminal region-containing protein [Wolbachia pipientis]
MKLSIYAILSISLLLILMHVAATFKDWSGYRKYIIKELERTYDAKVHIGGKVEVSLITPKLTIHNVYIQYNENKEQKLSDLISVRKIEIRPSFLSLLLFSLQPKSITLFGMKSNKENLINIINTKASGNIVDTVIKDSQVSFNADIINIKEVAVKKNKQFFGEVKVGDNNYDFSGKVNITKKNVYISVESNFVNLLFTGNRNQEELQGNLTLTINNSSNSVSDLAKIINPSFLSCVIPSENIEISSNINLDENEFTVTDLKIDSKSMQASGTIQNDRKGDHTNLNISFSKVDLDSIQDDLQRTTNMKDLLECFRAVVPKNLSLNFNMEASNIQYQNKILDNFRAVLKSTDGKVKVNTLLKFPGINNISYLSGEISNNNALSEFNGDLLVEGNDFESFISCFFPSIKMKEKQKNQFTLSSKLHLAPRILSISDIRLLNNKESLQGSIRVSHTKKRSVIDGKFSMHNLDADKYDPSLFSSLSKMQRLKNFQYDANIKASVNNLTLNDTKIKNLDFLLKMEKGKLVADKIKLSGEDFDITGNAKILVDQKYAKPLLDVNLTGNKFNGNIFKLPNLVEVKRNSRNEIDQIQWSTKQLNFLDDKEGFDANVQINTAEFKTEQNVLKDFNLDAAMRNNVITIKQASYVLEHGQVSFQGYLRSDSMNTRFSIVNLDTKKIGKVIGIDNVNGQVSLNGEIKTQGKSFHDWASNLSGDVNLQAQGIEVTNADFNSFITNLLSSKNKSEISTFAYVDIYNGSTFFENISGKASIKSGICSTSLQFGIDQASGSISSNLTLSNFALASIFRFFFIPPNYSNPIYIDMHLDGPIWRPKVSFDVDQIFIALVGKRNS